MVGITSVRRLAEALRGTPVSKSRPTHRFQTCERKSAWGTPERVPLFMLCPIVGHGDLHVKKGRHQERWRSSFGLLLNGSCYYVCQKLTGPTFVDTHFFRLSLYGIATRDSRGLYTMLLNGRVEWPLRETVTFWIAAGMLRILPGRANICWCTPPLPKVAAKGEVGLSRANLFTVCAQLEGHQVRNTCLFLFIYSFSEVGDALRKSSNAVASSKMDN